MKRLAQAVRGLQVAGSVVVASTGNDSTCRRSYPAALPGVVSVGAIGSNDLAPFTNYGDWVCACAPGAGGLAPSSISGNRKAKASAQRAAYLLDGPALLRWPQLGTVVNSTPFWQIDASSNWPRSDPEFA